MPQCGRFSGHRNSLKQSPFQELESLVAVWFKQARGSSALISGTVPKVKVLHTATMLGIKILEVLIAGLMVSNNDTVFCTNLHQESVIVYTLQWGNRER